MNYLSTLSIFVKQTTYLATLPNPPHTRIRARTEKSQTRFCSMQLVG